MKIALAGNPNSGKTTLFNALTGKKEYVGNWAGVTVEKKEAPLLRKFVSKSDQVTIVDLPGAYSISPFTGEEAITRDFILDDAPDAIINIVDGANFERSLFFTTQLLELGIPVVIALNKTDVLQKRGSDIDINLLADSLKCSIVSTTATSQDGLKQLMSKAVEVAKSKNGQIAPIIESLNDDSDKSRQQFISSLVSRVQVKTHDMSRITLSDKFDRIVAHKYLGLPIFFLIMWAVYAFSIEGLGGYLSGYLNDTLFGEIVPDAVNGFLEGVGVSPMLQALIVDGAIAGVGAVIGFCHSSWYCFSALLCWKTVVICQGLQF